MLSKKYRADKFLLNSLKEKKPQYTFNTGSILLKYYTYNSLLFAVIIPKKHYNKATKRVYIKRVVKRHLQSKLKFLKNGVYVIIFIRPLKVTNDEEIISELNKALSKNIKYG